MEYLLLCCFCYAMFRNKIKFEKHFISSSAKKNMAFSFNMKCIAIFCKATRGSLYYAVFPPHQEFVS